ncbi:putative C6 transcription factor [Aspergillus aculeatinus CBS 121060]|uniref:C6 transcription factor n=1 Tax=Aspergillus aculeatinus CBS 121060 TaxID=1448322 RepID=A0ACD1H1M3_9EURO|nr:putative C6 transcription factor [Aspergillus aculeatinus CBS 121060]RAH67465.1 putative C6 transcription factor [Aspergillus aculeatinus CBS 121060]
MSSKVTRSSLACLPCRSRHLKCDGKRPSCSRCVEVAQACEYTRSRRGGLDRAALAERRKRLAAAATETITNIPTSTTSPPSPPSNSSHPQTHIGHSDQSDQSVLLDLYYRHFHSLHPYAPPQAHFQTLLRDPSHEVRWRPLRAVMCCIGHIYHAHEWSDPLEEQAETCLAQASPLDPVLVPSRLLYSIALFWYGQKEQALSQNEQAGRLAKELQIYQSQFAVTHGGGDRVLQECWRRAWWAVYVLDLFFAGTLGTMTFAFLDVEATAGLPCEEHEYESGVIPAPKTLQDFDCREFALDDPVFSSFTYLIGAARCAAMAIATAPRNTVKEDSTRVIQTADSILDAWLLLLPPSRKQLMSKTGEIDELMYQAHLLIHVASIGLHRPFSDLKFNPVEDLSSCARDPPPDAPTPELVNVHTVRVLRSVEAQVRLLALPVQQFHHTPFVTCMISEGALSLLSACYCLLAGKELAIARDQIRMIIGCLKTLGALWPRTAKNVREIQTIASHVLGLTSVTAANVRSRESTGSSELPSLSHGEGTQASGTTPEASMSGSELDVLLSLDSLHDMCGWFNMGDLDADPSWGPGIGL